MKRILFITREIVPFYYGGIGTLFKAVAKALRCRGYEVAVMGERPSDFVEESFRSHYGNIRSFFYSSVHKQNEASPIDRAREVWRNFREIYSVFRPDMVIVADFRGECLFVLLDAQAGLYTGTTFVLTINGMHMDIDPVHEGSEGAFWEQWLQNPVLRLSGTMEDLSVQLSDFIVAPTAWVWDRVRDRTGIEREVRIIPNLSDKDFFCDVNGGNGTGGRGTEHGPVILFIGRLDRIKGADILLEAYLHLAKTETASLPRLVFVGPDCHWKEYGTTFSHHWRTHIDPALRDRISFAGQIPHEQIRAYLRRAVLCVFPSRWEAFGIVCLEAMQAGCPVLVSHDTGLAEVIGPSFPELTVDIQRGTEVLAAAIQNILTSLPVRSDLPDRLRERAQHIHREAEEAWISLIEDAGVGSNRQRNHAIMTRDLFKNMLLLLASGDDKKKETDASHLQVYFKRKGGYSESNMLRLSYPSYRWSTLRLALPGGTGEKPLRLDPADEKGLILLDTIQVLVGKKEIWRCDGVDALSKIEVVGEGDPGARGRWFAFDSRTADPQFHLDCPAIEQDAVLKIRLCFEPHR